MASECLGIALNARSLGPSQYTEWEFVSFCHFNGYCVGAGPNGTFILSGDTDDNASGEAQDIDAYVELATTDFGIQHQKRVRRAHVGYEADGDVQLTLYNSEGNARAYTLSPTEDGQLQAGARVSVGRGGKGRYWSAKIANVDGSDFGLNHLTLDLVVLPRKPGGA